MPGSSGFELFRDKKNVYQPARVKRWPLVVLSALLLAVVAGNAWWFHAARQRPALERELEQSRKTAAVQAKQLERLNTHSAGLEQGLEKLRGTDAQLRELVRLDKEANKAASSLEAQGEKGQDAVLLARLEAQEAYLRALAEPARMAKVEAASLPRLVGEGTALLGAVPDAWPVDGVISSGFGVRLSPFAGQEEFHKGVDIMAPAGSPVLAPAPGAVVFAGTDAEGALAVVLDHGGGYVSSFSHLESLTASRGQTVGRGDALGAVGQTGRSTGPHLHYEVRLFGLPVNPRNLLP